MLLVVIEYKTGQSLGSKWKNLLKIPPFWHRHTIQQLVEWPKRILGPQAAENIETKKKQNATKMRG